MEFMNTATKTAKVITGDWLFYINLDIKMLKILKLNKGRKC